MNHIFKSIYNTALGTCVVCSELSKAKGKKSSRSVGGAATALALTAVGSFFPLDSVYAACRDLGFGANHRVYASAGDTCDATRTTYSYGNIAYASGNGSVLNFTQDTVTLDNTGVGTSVQELGVGGSNGGGVRAIPGSTVNANNLNIISSQGQNTRSIYIHPGMGEAGRNTLNIRNSLDIQHNSVLNGAALEIAPGIGGYGINLHR